MISNIREIPKTFHQNRFETLRIWPPTWHEANITRKHSNIFDESADLWGQSDEKNVQHIAALVELEQSYNMNIYLQKSASIQPRTSPTKYS